MMDPICVDGGMRKSGFTLIEVIIVVGIIGILLAIAIPNILLSMHRARQRAAVADIKIIAEAVESYRIDIGFVPAAAAGQTLPAVPVYIQNVPQLDPWQTTYKYYNWRDDNDKEYRIQSLGADRQAGPSPTGDQLVGSAFRVNSFADFKIDIIYQDGSFTQYPFIK